jgi:hypothetical protein
MNKMRKTVFGGPQAIALVALTLMLALFGAVGTVDAQSDSGMPLPGTIMNVQPVTIVESAVYTSDQQTAALDISRYNGGDLFVTVDVADASALTTTIQYSADGENYADCYWLSAEGDGTFATNTCQTIQTADGTAYTRAAIAGQYGRLDMDVTGTVTVTAYIVLRNN